MYILYFIRNLRSIFTLFYFWIILFSIQKLLLLCFTILILQDFNEKQENRKCRNDYRYFLIKRVHNPLFGTPVEATEDDYWGVGPVGV